MCGRFTLRTPTLVLAKTFHLATIPTLTPRYNVAPGQSIGVIRSSIEAQQPTWTTMRWGLVPSWAKDPKIAYRMINARSESAAKKPAFRSAMRKRRCLIVADGYYEWESVGKSKIPHFIRMLDETPFAMAGLWESWQDPQQPTESPLETCTILTTESNELTHEFHERMPVILDQQHWDWWMDPTFTDTDPLQELLRSYPSDAMQQSEVSDYVNNARHEGPECLQPVRRLF